MRSLVLIFLIVTLITSCNKEDNAENCNTCIGDRENIYFPLVLGARWHYNFESAGWLSHLVTQAEAVDGDSCYTVSSERFYAQEPSYTYERKYVVKESGDVYLKHDNGNEYLYVPSEPIEGNMWEYEHPSNSNLIDGTREVFQTDFSHFSSEKRCLHDHILVLKNQFINENTGDTIIEKDYFDKGFGPGVNVGGFPYLFD